MANIGDLVVRMQLENDDFVAKLTDTDAQAKYLNKSLLEMERAALKAQQAFQTARDMRNFSGAQDMHVGMKTWQSNASLEQAQLATENLRAELGQTAIQTNTLKIKLEELTQATLRAQEGNIQYAKAARDGATYQQMLALAIENKKRALMEDALAAKLDADAMAYLGIKAKTTAAAMELSTVAARENSVAIRRSAEIARNAIYAVEDAASVYGTMGWSGVARAVSNNVTMMAMAYGQLEAAIVAVAATTAIQLYFALTKTKDATKEATAAVVDYSRAIESIKRSAAAPLKFEEMMQGLDSSKSAQTKIDERIRDIAEMEAQKTELIRLADRLDEDVKGTKWNDKDAQKTKDRAAEYRRNAVVLESKINQEKRENVRLQETLNMLLKKEQTIAQAKFRDGAVNNLHDIIKKWNAAEQSAAKAMRNIQDAIDPKGAARRSIADQIEERRKAINATPGLSDAQRSAMLSASQLAGEKELARAILQKGGENKGPSATEKGSREAYEYQRQMMLRQPSTEKDMKQQLDLLHQDQLVSKGVLEKSAGILQKILDKFQNVGALGN